MRSFNSSGICNLVFIKPRHGHYNSEDLRNSALNHLGIPRLPDFSAQAALVSGKLVQVLKGWTLKGAFADEIYLIRPYSPHVPKSVSALVGYLKEKLSGGFRFVG